MAAHGLGSVGGLLTESIKGQGARATDTGLAQIANRLVTSRSTTSPRRLVAPGPSENQLMQLFEMAAAAPDHGRLVPWRFIVVPDEERHRLAEVFARALVMRDPGASLAQIDAAREKAHRAPLLIVVVARLGPDPSGIPELERMVAVGAAVQNVLLGAHAMGFGSGLTSGQAMATELMAELLGLGGTESAVCCINMGTVSQAKVRVRDRPAPSAFVSRLRG